MMTRCIASTCVDHSDGYSSLVGLIGWPAPFWPTASIYNAAFRALEMDWSYVSLPVCDGQLREALLGLRALGFVGAEVAEPYQSEALKYLGELSPAAKITEAVTFIEVDEHGHLTGDNTRWQGFLTPLRSLVPSLDGLRPLIIGAGYAARGIVYALTREGLPLTIVDEDIERAIDLVHRLRHVMDEHSFSVYRWPHDLERVARDANLIVNTTTIGAWPQINRSPWPDDVPFAPGALVFDLVRWPAETRFLRQARVGGARTVHGLALLVCELAMVFKRWTGRAPPIQVMWRAARQALGDETFVKAPCREHFNPWQSAFGPPTSAGYSSERSDLSFALACAESLRAG